MHDVGRVGVPSGIWDHPGPLTAEQWERVRLHPYLGERVLARCALLAPFAELAARHHERADGSGYHRGVVGRPARARRAGARGCRRLPRHDRGPPAPAGARPREAAAAAARRGRRRAASGAPRSTPSSSPPAQPRGRHRASPHPAGLTDREVEVLRLIAAATPTSRSRSMLGISPKTVGRHVEHIYAKAGVSTARGRDAVRHGARPAARTDRPAWGEHPIARRRSRPSTRRRRPSKEESAMSATATRPSEQIGSTSAPATGRPSPSGSRATGRALVMVHGSIADHTHLRRRSSRCCATDMTTFSIDRRGFGASGDAAGYAIERDFEDVAAVVDAVAARTGGPVAAVGPLLRRQLRHGRRRPDATTSTTSCCTNRASACPTRRARSTAIERRSAAGDHGRGASSTVLVDILEMTDGGARCDPAEPRCGRFGSPPLPTVPRECRAEEGWVYRTGPVRRRSPRRRCCWPAPRASPVVTRGDASERRRRSPTPGSACSTGTPTSPTGPTRRWSPRSSASSSAS